MKPIKHTQKDAGLLRNPFAMMREKAAAASSAAEHIRTMRSRVDCAQGNDHHLHIAKLYRQYRLQGQNDRILEHLSQDFVFFSQRDGVCRGKEAFYQYLEKTPTEGNWSDPYLADNGLVRFDGSVRYMGVVPISVCGVFRFSPDGKISELFVGKA